MKIDLQRKIDRYAGVFICRLLSLFSRLTGAPPAPAKIDRILIILLSEMGSLVLAGPMCRLLRRKYPGASLHFLIFEKNREVFEVTGLADRDHVLTIRDDSIGAFTGDSLRAVGRMRRDGFDVVIDCELFARVSSILAFMSGAPLRVGFHPHTQEGLYRGSFINRPVLYNPYRHISRQFIALAQAIDSHSVPKAKEPLPDGELEPSAASIGEEEVARLKERLYGDYPTLREGKLVLVYPGGGVLPIRAWPIGHFGRLSAALLEAGHAVAVIGLDRDREPARDILAHCRHPRCVDLTGYTKTVRELMGIFQFASLLITNDGGPGHFASMTPIPSIMLFGPETPDLYRPLGDGTEIFFRSIPCSPCVTAYNHRSSPCDGDNVCLKEILPEEVLEKALELL